MAGTGGSPRCPWAPPDPQQSSARPQGFRGEQEEPLRVVFLLLLSLIFLDPDPSLYDPLFLGASHTAKIPRSLLLLLSKLNGLKLFSLST